MAIQQIKPPLIVIVGPTASGKTTTAIEFAKKYDGEIICADSRTVYRGMDIGTAKPTLIERAQVPHWGLDLVEPGERFTVADFKKYALECCADIRARGKLPLLVGGTGLYIDAVIFDYQFGPAGGGKHRAFLEKMTISELREHCIKNSIELSKDSKNKRHLVRAIEMGGVNKQRRDRPLDKTIVVGIATDKTQLRTRIFDRSEHILTNGVVEEAIRLGKKYGWQSEAMTGNIYPLVYSYLKGERTLNDVRDDFTTLDWKLAKRQLTWFRRNPYIAWQVRSDALAYLESSLATQ